MKPEKLDIGGQAAEGYVIPLETCNLVFMTQGNSLLACGAVNAMALDTFNVPTATVSGVATVEDLLDGEVKTVNKAAEALGVAPGQTGREALAKL